jgi:hypothetical protein
MKLKKFYSIMLSLLLIAVLVACDDNNNNNKNNDENFEMPEINEDYPLTLWYDEEAPITKTENYSIGKTSSAAGSTADDSWEEWSLPIGNGYFGANVFGRTDTERIQISEKTITNPNEYIDGNSVGGLNNFSETYIDFGHEFSDVENYSRYLNLYTAVSGVEYTYDDVTYTREYFTSYPDKALVIRLDADCEGALSFILRPTIPYEQDYMTTPGDRISKHGTVTSSVEKGVGYIELSGKMGYYDIDFLGLYKVYIDGGEMYADTTEHSYKDTAGITHKDEDGTIVVEGATSAYIVVTLGTDYELSSEMFTNETELNNCLRNEGMATFGALKPTFNTNIEDTRKKVEADMAAIDEILKGSSFNQGYYELKYRHIEDYYSLFGRNTLELESNSIDFDLTTGELLKYYKDGQGSNYLEVL